MLSGMPKHQHSRLRKSNGALATTHTALVRLSVRSGQGRVQGQGRGQGQGQGQVQGQDQGQYQRQDQG
jgi:hypothetical protein